MGKQLVREWVQTCDMPPSMAHSGPVEPLAIVMRADGDRRHLEACQGCRDAVPVSVMFEYATRSRPERPEGRPAGLAGLAARIREE